MNVAQQALTNATAQVSLSAESGRKTNAEYQATFRATPLGKQRAAEQAASRKAVRQARRLDYQERQRSAVVGCVAVGKRRRDVGLLKNKGEQQ
jgi:hypothetical protein